MAMEKKYVLDLRYPKAYLPPDYNKPQLIIPIGLRWSDLPEDIFGEIVVRLSSADRIRLAACCKTLWSLIPSGEINQFPWVVKLNFRICTNKSVLFQLFDPAHEKPYSITYVPEKFTGDRMTPLCCRNGWILLLGRRKQILQGKLPRLSLSVVLVSPFTKQVIALPDFDHSSFPRDPLRCVKASFSCNPLSPDCVYIVLWEREYRKVRFSTFRNGDTEWNTSEYPLPLVSFDSVVYHEGSFYCVSGYGFRLFVSGYGYIERHNFQAAAYNIFENKWRCFHGPKRDNQECTRYLSLLVCEGKLVSVLLEGPFSESTTIKEELCIVYEYVQQNGNWVEKKSLGDNAFYLSRLGSFSVSTSSSDMANRIYYVIPRGVEKKYYSLEDDKAYLCESTCWPGVKRQGTWIEPAQLGK